MTPTLYSPAVLSWSKDTSATGKLADPTHTATWDNPLCGDRVRLSVRVEAGVVHDLRHATRGCALCKASAAVLAQAVTGKTVPLATQLAQDCALALGAPGSPRIPPLLEDFQGLQRAPARASCVALPWEALLRALEPRQPTAEPVEREPAG